MATAMGSMRNRTGMFVQLTLQSRPDLSSSPS
jgi:hypothetical protein